MKRRLIFLISLLLILAIGTAQAASYTLPEKMYNQLAIGSGLKGVFTISTEGEKFDTPFLRVITDAEFSLRGIQSGQDLHYYVFQQKSEDQQSAVSELYRKDGTYYFRSDMVQGKILSLPALDQFMNALFPAKGENMPATPFITRILSLSDAVKKSNWEPVLNRYQNELELWLANFTVEAESVKMENGLSAIDFTYVIPMDRVYEQITRLFSEFASDSEVSTLLDSVMSAEEKQLYVNGNLLYFYEEALKTLTTDGPVQMSKRVSAMGEQLRFRLELPTDVRTTGFESISIENNDKVTVYTLKKPDEVLVAAIPAAEVLKQNEFDLSMWFARVKTDASEEERNQNFSVRIDAVKTHEAMNDAEEKSHETNRYRLKIVPDTSCLPGGVDLSALPEREEIEVDADLHYSSKYAQNSSTMLEISAEILEGSSSMKINGTLKTAAPWLFMPFEITDPIASGTEIKNVIAPYLADWISNAASMITHIEEETEQETAAEPADETQTEAEPINETDHSDGENMNTQVETIPMEEAEQETNPE